MDRKKRVFQDPSRLVAHQEALAQFGRYALQSDDIEAVLAAACEQVASALDVPMAKIATVVPGSDVMLLKAAVGIPETAGIPGVTTVPRGEGSAMGYTLLMRSPIVSTVDHETRFAPSEVVQKSQVRSSVNVVIWTGHEPFGILEADSREPDVFGEQDIHFLELYANLLGAAVERQRLSSQAKTLAQQRELLLKESVHRIKNILSIVFALSARTRKDSESIDEFMQAFNGRISALSRLQDLMLVKGGHEQSVPMAELARAEMAASGAREGDQFLIKGPAFECSPITSQALGLFFHELTTNACKYGALAPEAPPNARIEVSWKLTPSSLGSDVELYWKERGGASRDSNHKKGFGSELLREGVARMLGGTTEFEIHEHGVDCALRFFQESQPA